MIKSMIFPCVIFSEAIEMGEGANMTPRNGRMFSCRSHFHSTTSLTRSYGYSVSNRFGALELRLLTMCSFSRSLLVATLRIFNTMRRSWKVALYTFE